MTLWWLSCSKPLEVLFINVGFTDHPTVYVTASYFLLAKAMQNNFRECEKLVSLIYGFRFLDSGFWFPGFRVARQRAKYNIASRTLLVTVLDKFCLCSLLPSGSIKRKSSYCFWQCKFTSHFLCLKLLIMHLSSAISWGDPGQIQLYTGTFRGVWTIILPWGWGKWGRFGFRKPCTPGKTGDFVKEIGQFQVALHQ